MGESGMSADASTRAAVSASALRHSATTRATTSWLRWRHVYDEDSDWTLQTYFDNFERDTFLNSETVKTLDVEFQYRFPLSDRQQITCGAGYPLHPRVIARAKIRSPQRYSVPAGPRTSPASSSRTRSGSSHDLLATDPGLQAGAESRTRTSSISRPPGCCGPPIDKHSAWGAVSRAVHTPCGRREPLRHLRHRDSDWAVLSRVLGNEDLHVRDLMAYELGYRAQATEQVLLGHRDVLQRLPTT